MSFYKWINLFAVIALLGCNQVAPTQPLELTIAHLNDHLSHLSESQIELKINGSAVRSNIGGFPRVIEAIQAIEADNSNVLKVHAGNAITGNIFYTLFEGEADAAQMKIACFDVFGIGSNDFNAGEPDLRKFLTRLNNTSCKTTAVGSNIQFNVGTSSLALVSNEDFIKPYIIKEYQGEKVGIIGVINSVKTPESSSPRLDTKFADELKSVKKAVKALHKANVNKIIVVSSLGYNGDIALVSELTGVSVVIGADSHTLMGDFSNLGLESSVSSYPAFHTDADGQRVCIAHAWQYTYALGELKVNWDASGRISHCSGSTHLLFGRDYQVKNSEGKWQAAPISTQRSIAQVLNESPYTQEVEPDLNAQDDLASFQRRIERKQRVVIGEASENLCLERLPGQGKSELCDVTATQDYGSDISNIVAKSFMMAVKTADFGIQNGGGVRNDLAQGPVTLGHIQNMLPFGNTLVELEMTGSEVRQVLEEAIHNSLVENGSTGSYPYASGIRWRVDASKDEGRYITQLEVNPRLSGSWSPIDPQKTYHVVTNNYIASGHDGYATFGQVVRDRRFRETYLNYAQPMSEYVRSVGTLSRLPLAEYSTQSFLSR